MFDAIRVSWLLSPVLKAAGGWRALSIWRRWNLYYAGLMAKSAEQCGWNPNEVSDDPVWQALTAVYWHIREFPSEPPKEVPPTMTPLLAILRWAQEHICERDLPEAKAKYVEMLRALLYRAYRKAIYRRFLVPLVRAGEVETVLSLSLIHI